MRRGAAVRCQNFGGAGGGVKPRRAGSSYGRPGAPGVAGWSALVGASRPPATRSGPELFAHAGDPGGSGISNPTSATSQPIRLLTGQGGDGASGVAVSVTAWPKTSSR